MWRAGASRAVRRFCGASVVAVFLMSAGGAQAELDVLKPDVEYVLTYQVSNTESKVLSPVRIINIVTIGGEAFLVVDTGTVNFPKIGYVALKSVRSIISAKQ